MILISKQHLWLKYTNRTRPQRWLLHFYLNFERAFVSKSDFTQNKYNCILISQYNCFWLITLVTTNWIKNKKYNKKRQWVNVWIEMRLCFLRFLMCKTVPNLAHDEVIIQLHRNSSLSHGLKAHTVTARQWRVKKFSIWGRTKFTAKIWTLSEASDIFGLNVLIVIFSDSALWKHIIANEKGLDLYVATFHISWGSFRDSVSSNAEWQLRP